MTKEQVKQMLEDILTDEQPSMNEMSRGSKAAVSASIEGSVITCYTMEKLLALSKLCGWSFFSACSEDRKGNATTTIEFYTYGYAD